MTAQDFFGGLPAALQKHAEAVKAIGGCYLFSVSGNGGGTWLVDLASSEPCVRVVPPDGSVGGFGCHILISTDDFEALLADPSQATAFYFTGRLKVEGDVMLAARWPRLFALLKE